MKNPEELVRALVRLPNETLWVEFKHNCYDAEMVGERICGLANVAAADDRRTAYLIWGIDNVTHEIKGTTEDFPTDRSARRMNSILGCGKGCRAMPILSLIQS